MPSCLSSTDRRLLHAWFLLRGDLTLLAQQENAHILDLIAWSESPAIQTAIAKIKALRELCDDLHRSETHREAIDKLVHVLKTSTNLVELRRTATTILRGPTTPRAPRTQKSPPAHPPPPGEVPRSSAAEGAPFSTSSLSTLREPTLSTRAATAQTPRPAEDNHPEAPRSQKPLVRCSNSRPRGPSSLHRAAGFPSPHSAPPLELLESITSPHEQFAALPRAP